MGLVYLPILNYVRAEIIINCFVVTLTLAVVCLRVLGRLSGPGLWWDDWMVIGATVCPQ